MGNNHGPNVTKLIVKLLPRFAVPPGGGIADGLRFFTDAEYRQAALDLAEALALKVIRLVRIAPDNPYADDEAIAGALLAELENKKPAA